MNFLKYLLFLIVPFLIFSCSDDDDQPELEVVNNCENGYQEIDGSCVCPEGMYSAYGSCRELKEDEYYGITEGCLCEDTLFVKFGVPRPNRGSNPYADSLIQIEYNSDLGLKPTDNGDHLSFSTSLYYTQLIDGDSIFTPGGPPGGNSPLCLDENGQIEFVPDISMKRSADKSTLEITLIYYNHEDFFGAAVDTCKFVFTR